tara:strand:+ start:87 stop:533 length:447 start_codon:yes stop_codon:yes gene_type:complete
MQDPLGGANPWENYFGPSSHELKTNAYDKYSYETYDLPEAYKGKNLFLRDTIARHDSAEDFSRLNSFALRGPGLHAHSGVLLCTFMTGRFHYGGQRVVHAGRVAVRPDGPDPFGVERVARHDSAEDFSRLNTRALHSHARSFDASRYI